MGQETPITAKYRRCSGCHAEFFKHPERASLLLFNTLRFAIHKNGKIYLSNKVLRLQVQTEDNSSTEVRVAQEGLQ